MLSRTASNLYWMARYVERMENTARILDVTYRMSLVPKDARLADQEWYAPLNITGTLYPFSGRFDEVNSRGVLHFMTLDRDNPSSIVSCARAARENARAVRGHITAEMWEVINGTWLEIQKVTDVELTSNRLMSLFEWVKERSHLFRGVTVGTMLSDQAFHFNRLGTFMERADNTTRILDVKYHVLLPSIDDVGGAVDYYQWAAVLRSVSAFAAYRRVYRDVITPLRVAELLILRDDMPRSLHHCMRETYEMLRLISGGVRNEAVRLAGEAHAGLHFGRVDAIFAEGLHEYLTDFLRGNAALGDEVTRTFFSAGRQSLAA
ncbi:MAG: alpha-E domain-containing protein [Betaproteobacteria bacterium]